MESLFRGQQVFMYFWSLLSDFDFVIGLYLYSIGIQLKSPNDFRQNPLNFSVFTQVKKLNRLGDFRFKEFGSQEEFDSYVQSPDYGLKEEFAGVCFAFSIKQHAQNSYELDLQFNDQLQSHYQSIPRQSSSHVAQAQFLPAIEEYSKYQWFGFAYMQNWVANMILKRVT